MNGATATKKKDGDSEGDSGFVTPDSTTREKVPQFCEGEDVLSHGKDGLYYLGTIVLADAENERCLVQFEDRTAHWSLFKDIRKLRIPESDELCVICKSSKTFENNEIVLCYICDQGYHQKCLKPEVCSEYCEPESQWECPKCSHESSFQKEEKKKSKENSPRKLKSKPTALTEEDYKQSLPYELNSLTWDAGHKTNKEETYCYCGGPGEWYNRMLQCQKCNQWFHEACVDCLHIPLLYGDRFYVFICGVCNSGMEFLHRLDLKWIDVIHLAMFNLTLQESRMYFEYESGITYWINENWELLQCPLGLQNLRVQERKHEVLRILESNRTRFKCGKECRKRTSLWGLRLRVPPSVPSITLPHNEIITENSIKKMVVRFKSSTSPPIPRNFKLKEDKLDPVDDILSRYSPAKKRAMSPGVYLSHDEEEIEIELENFEEEEKAVTVTGGMKRKRKREVDILMEDKKAKKMIEDIGLQSCLVDPAHDSVGNSYLDGKVEVKRKRGRPPKKQECNGNEKSWRRLHLRHSHLLRHTVKENQRENVSRKPLVECPPSPPAPPQGDTSGDDTSSHGTLESFIPPPTNFEGHNHPFLNLESAGYGMPLVRPLKRKLSENDIKIGKNGEVKRRRFRRKLGKLNYAFIQASSFGSLTGKAGDLNALTAIKNCVDYALSGRLLQNGTDGEGRGDLAGFSLSDLKSSVNTYFGASNRIANGEKFRILARRTNEETKTVQFLLEWGEVNGDS